MGGYTLVRKAFTRKFSGRGGKVLRNVCSPFASRFTSVRYLCLSFSLSVSPPMTAFSVFLLGRKGRWNRRRLLISVRFNVILVSSSSCDVCAVTHIARGEWCKKKTLPLTYEIGVRFGSKYVARTRRKGREKEGVEMRAAKREKKTEKMRAVRLKKREKEEVSAFIVWRSVFIPS